MLKINVSTLLERFVFLVFFLNKILVKLAGFCDVFWLQQSRIPAAFLLMDWEEQEQQSSPCRGFCSRRRALPGPWRGAIQHAFRLGVGGEGGRGGTRALPSQRSLGASGQECESKFKSVSAVPDPGSLGVPLSRSLQYLRELPNGMCGIHVIHLTHENGFPLSLPWCLRQKYFWFPAWCSNHQAAAAPLKPGYNGSSGQPPASGQAEADGMHAGRRGGAAFDPALSLGREDLIAFAFLPRLNH